MELSNIMAVYTPSKPTIKFNRIILMEIIVNISGHSQPKYMCTLRSPAIA